MYALIENGTVSAYPLSINGWRMAHPSVSLPAEPTEQQLNEQGIFNVLETQPPVTDFAHTVVDDGVVQVDGTWTHLWSVREATEAEAQANKQAIYDQIVVATQASLDAFARTHSYDSILSACTYANSAVPRFQVDGQYCVEARDATWAKLYEMLAEVEAGTRPVPSGFADVSTELPALVWPV